MAVIIANAYDNIITPTQFTNLFPWNVPIYPSVVADSIYADAGNDYVDGGGGADMVFGSLGDDTIVVRQGGHFYGEADDDLLVVLSAGAGTEISGGAGMDSLDTQGAVNLTGATVSGIETLLLDSATLTLTGSQLAGFTTIKANGATTTGNLVMSGGGTASTDIEQLTRLNVTGSSVDDRLAFFTLTATNTAINFNGGAGNDSILAYSGHDTLVGDIGDDTLRGLAGNDSLTGGTGADMLYGSNGVDTLNGGTGNDLLVGGSGGDRLTGGTSSDRFQFEGAFEGVDTITDFGADDLLSILSWTFGGGLSGTALTPGQLVVGASNVATGPAGAGQFVFNTANSTLLWDADGSGAQGPVVLARMTGVTTLDTSDFILVA